MVIAKNKRFILSVNLDRFKKFTVYQKVYYDNSDKISFLQAVATGEYLCKSIARYFTARQIERARRLAAKETKRWFEVLPTNTRESCAATLNRTDKPTPTAGAGTPTKGTKQ